MLDLIFETIKKKDVLFLFLVFFINSFGISAQITGSIDAPDKVCVGQDVTFTADFTGVDSSTEYRFTIGSTVGSWSSDNSYRQRMTVSGSFTVSVEVRSPAAPPVTKTINVLPKPVANAGEDTTICPRTSIMIGSDPQPGVSYKWNQPAGWFLTSDQVTLSNPMTTANPGIGATHLFSVTASYTDLPTCLSIDTIYLTVKTDPPFPAGMTNQTICDGEAAQLGGASQTGVNYVWSPAELLEDNTIPDPVTVPLSGQNYTFTVTAGWSDLPSCPRTSGNVIVNTRRNPVVTAGEDRSVCHRGTSQLGGAPIPNVAYDWRPNRLDNNKISNPTTNELFQDTQFFLEATDTLTGCITRDTVNIKVIQPATPQTLSGGGSYCEGGSLAGNYVELASSETGVSYDLYRNGVNFSTKQGTASTLRWEGIPGGIYTVIAYKEIDGIICETPLEGSVTITEFKLPAATITALRDSICSGQQDPELRVDFTGTPPFTFIVENSVDNKIDTLRTGSMTYTINKKIISNRTDVFIWTIKEVLSETNGCRNTFGGKNPQDTVRVDVVPNVRIEASEDMPVCAKQPFTLSAIGGNPALESYSWSPTGATGSPVTVAPSIDTDYILTARNINNTRCFSRDTFVVKVKPLDEVIISGLNADRLYCSDDDPVTLSSTPPGAVFSGSGVNSITNQFDPSQVLGRNIIQYTIMGANQCLISNFDSVWVNKTPDVNFSVSANPFVGGGVPPYENPLSICLPDNSEVFLQGSPSINGEWTFRELGESATTLDISRPGLPPGAAYLVHCVAGTYTLEYAHTDTKGCVGREEKTVFVVDVAPDPIPMGTLVRKVNGWKAGDVMCKTSSWEEIQVEGTTDAATGKFHIDPVDLIEYQNVETGQLIINPSNATFQNKYNISYSIVDGNGCTHSTSKDFYISPPINPFFVGLDSTYCENSDEVFFTFNSDMQVDSLIGKKITIIKDGVTMSTDYEVKPGDPILFKPLGAGIYKFYNEFNDGVCDGIDSATVRVIKKPDVNLIIPDTVCYGENIPLVANFPGGSYLYQKDGGEKKQAFGEINTTEVGIGLITIFYDVEVDGCPGSDSTTVQITGIKDFGLRQRCTVDDERHVFLTGSEVGTTYILYANNVPFDTIQGTGGEVQFEKTISTQAYCFVQAKNTRQCEIILAEKITLYPLDVKLTKTDISCFGEVDGTATAIVSGGLYAYDFIWKNTAGDIVRDSIVKSLKPDTYYFETIDSVGCSHKDTIEITEPELLQAPIVDIYFPVCAGDENGRANVKVSGGTPGFSYLWIKNPGLSGQDTIATTASLVNVGIGVYEVQVTDRNGCTANNRLTFNQNAPMRITINNVVHNQIFGEENGEIQITVTGGEEPYLYSWQGLGISAGNQNNEDLINLQAGRYFLDVTDNKGCIVDTSILIQQPEELLVEELIVPVSCFGTKTGSITLNVHGGQKEYSIVWTGDNGFSSTKQNIDSLVAGIYSVTITDAVGKSFQGSYEVPEPRLLQINTLPRTNIELLCYGDSTGVIDIAVDGGLTPYQIKWESSSLPSGDKNLTTYEKLPADNYSVRVTDLNGCMVEEKYEIKPQARINIRRTIKSVSCADRNDGIISLYEVSGGVEPYRYFWTGGNSVMGNQNQSGLRPGTYYVEVQDANLCTKIDSFVIKPAVLSTVTMSAKETFCLGDTTELRFDFTGVPTLFVNYSDGVNNEFAALTNSPSFVKVSLDKNTTYQITGASDGNMCSASYSDKEVDITMLPSPILTVVNIPGDICLGDSIEVDLFLQQGPTWSIEYSDNGGIRTVDNITDANYKLKIATSRPGKEQAYEIVSVSNGQCKIPVNIPFVVNVRDYPAVNLTPPDYTCAGDTFSTMLEFTGDGPWTVDYHLGEFSRTDSIFNEVYNIKDVLFKNTAYHFNSITSKYGCTTKIDRKINVEVNPLPNDAFTVTGISAVCLGEGDYETPLIPNANSYHWTLPEGVEFVSGNETNKIKVRFTENAKAGLITVQGRNGCGLGVAASIFVTAPRILGKAGEINSVREICRNNLEPVVMSIPPIENADRYVWLLPPGFDIVFGENSSSIMVTTQKTAQSGTIKVWGENNCGKSDTSSLRVNILENPVVVAGADKTIGCNEENRIQFEALNPAPASGQWRLVWGNGIIADIYDPRTEVTGLALGRNLFYWEVDDGKCKGLDSVVITNVNVDLTNPAFSQTVTCMDSIALKAGKPRQGTGEWSLVGGGGTVKQINEMEAMVYDLEMGVNFFRWKVANEFCSRDTVIQVTSNSPKKYAFAGDDVTVFMPAAVMNARPTESKVTGSWSIVGGSSALDNLANPQSIVRNLSAGLNTFRWTVSYMGCVEFGEVTIFYDTDIVDPDKEDFIVFPNAFVPNPVFSNGGTYTLEIQIPHYRDIDVFYPVWNGVDKTKAYSLQIFNRWGNLIFQSNDIQRGWDGYLSGELAPIGTYMYKASGVFSNGKTFTKVGEINLLQ